MKTAIKSFVLGAIVGAAAGAWPAYNLGRNAPTFSNPFQKRTIETVIKEKANEAVETTREKIHDITKPERKGN
jgi:gas vesicle protein